MKRWQHDQSVVFIVRTIFGSQSSVNNLPVTMSSETPPDDVLKAMKGVMRRLDQKNIERINKMESLKARNRKVGFGISGIVIGICKFLTDKPSVLVVTL